MKYYRKSKTTKKKKRTVRMETNKSFNELVEKVQVNKVDSEEFLEIGEPS